MTAPRRHLRPSSFELIPVRIPGREYAVRVGFDLLPGLAAAIAGVVPPGPILVVADRNAWRHHGEALLRGLGRRRGIAVLVIPPGERSKSLAWVRRLYTAGHERRLGRDGCILAFGGGVVGDLAGFAAATWLRGVGLILVPTTLLAQVDSSIGGKVGVNFAGVKNLVGAFHQPQLVVSDTAVLSTLPRRELLSALAEVVKCGMIADPSLLDLLERESAAVLAGDPARLASIVSACVRIKARVVEADEREEGVRAWLNYGHTLGHALEAAAGGRLRHGEAVALGMRGAARLAESLGYLTRSDRARQDRLLDQLGLPARATRLTPEQVLSNLKWDKKVRARTVRFVLTRGIGSARLAAPVDRARVRRALSALLG